MAHQIQLWIFWDEVCTDLCRDFFSFEASESHARVCSHIATAHTTRNANAFKMRRRSLCELSLWSIAFGLCKKSNTNAPTEWICLRKSKRKEMHNLPTVNCDRNVTVACAWFRRNIIQFFVLSFSRRSDSAASKRFLTRSRIHFGRICLTFRPNAERGRRTNLLRAFCYVITQLAPIIWYNFPITSRSSLPSCIRLLGPWISVIPTSCLCVPNHLVCLVSTWTPINWVYFFFSFSPLSSMHARNHLIRFIFSICSDTTNM